MRQILFCIILALLSCSKEKSGNDIIDTEIDIFLENTSGENLFLPGTLGFIDRDQIRLFYVQNGISTEVYNPDMDCPRNVCYLDDFERPGVRVFPNITTSDEYPVTLIDWGNGDMDTIRCHILRKNNDSYVYCDKVWVNDEPFFPEKAITELGRAFKLVK